MVEGLDDLGGDPATDQRIVLGDPQVGVQDLLQLRAGGALADLNEYVQSPASKLEEPVIRRLYEALSGQYEPEKPKPPPEWQRQGRSHEGAVMVKSPGDRGALDQSSWHSRLSDDWWETRGDAAPAWELASWKMLEFTDAERDAWIAHGLRPGQVKDAVGFEMLGFCLPT
ncbi:MAG TPA: hypothetical protein VK754_00295 [Propionibacteriaceae bacterium]|nr:hypothetical protein [Propionibacteriaceae bacterium]